MSLYLYAGNLFRGMKNLEKKIKKKMNVIVKPFLPNVPNSLKCLSPISSSGEETVSTKDSNTLLLLVVLQKKEERLMHLMGFQGRPCNHQTGHYLKDRCQEV